MRIAWIIILLIPSYMHPIVVGSDIAVSRQARVFFPAADSDNAIIGFTVINDGITFENAATTGSYNGFFHVAGDVVFNQGKLILNQNIEFQSPLQFGVGYIDAQLFAILFPDNLSVFGLPNGAFNRAFTLCDQENIASPGSAVKWSYDGQYVAVTTLSGPASPELVIYSEDNCELTQEASANFFSNNDVNDVSWHPSSYKFAVAQSGVLFGDRVQTLEFLPGSGTINQLDSVTFLGSAIAVAWRPDGNFLAVGEQSSLTLRVYPINGSGDFGTAITVTLPLGTILSSSALAWHSSGSYLAVGASNTLGADLFIYAFNGVSLTQAGSVEIGGTVNALSWKPGTNLLSIGHSNSGDRLLTFEYDPGLQTLTEKETMRTGLQTEVLSVNWDTSGEYVAAGTFANSSDVEFQIYAFEPIDEKLNLATGYALNADVNGVAYKPNDDTKIVTVDNGGFATLFSFTIPVNAYSFIFEDAKIFFKSDVVINGPILFKGNCILNGGNNTIDMSATGSLIIDSGGSLVIEGVTIKNVEGNNISCSDNTASISWRDVVLNQSGYATFERGSFNITGDFGLLGGNIFAYRSSKNVTISSGVKWLLDTESTFSLDPMVESSTMLNFADKSSEIILNEASFITTMTSLELLRGSMIVHGKSAMGEQSALDLMSNFDRGITLGDSVIPGNDFHLNITPGSSLQISEGILNMKNSTQNSVSLANPLSVLHMLSGSTLRIFKTINIGEGKLIFESGTTLARAIGETIIGGMQIKGNVNRVTIPS
jgi:hypothetical protein